MPTPIMSLEEFEEIKRVALANMQSVSEQARAALKMQLQGRVELANPCQHAPYPEGRSCGGTGREIPVKPYDDEDQEFGRIDALEKHYGRKEMAPKMGGVRYGHLREIHPR